MFESNFSGLFRLINSIPDFIAYIGADLRYKFINDSYRTMFGESYKEILNKPVREVLGETAFQKAWPNMEKALSGTPAFFEDEFSYNVAGNRYVRGNYIPDINADGKVEGFFLRVTDITDQKRMEKELKTSEENYKYIFHNNAQIMCIWDLENYKFVEVNEAMVKHYGYSREEFLSMTVLDIRPPESVDQFKKAASELPPNYVIETLHFTHVKKDGTRIIVDNASTEILFKGRRCRIVLINDITERVRLQSDREALVVKQKEALKIRDEFLSMASHELKTPITSLLLQNEIRKRRIKNHDEAEKKYLETNTKLLCKLNRLIDDMLDVSRINMGKLQMNKDRINLAEVVRDVVERLRPELEQSISRIDLHVCDSANINGDSFRLEQVLTNLLTNAMKYGKNKPISITVTSDPQSTILTVKDQGRGINPEDHGRIFMQFERVVPNSEIGGLGIGLSIVKDIVEAHGGKICVESSLGIGSSFIIEFPTAEG